MRERRRTSARCRTVHPSRAARARCAVVADAVTTGRAVWLAEEYLRIARGRVHAGLMFDLGVPQFPTESFAPVNDIRFEAGSEAVAVTVERPLGIVFEERVDGVYTKIVVDEIPRGPTRRRAATCASATSCESPPPCSTSPASWTSRRGSSPPKATNCKAFFVCEQKGFDKVMSAIQSHVVPVTLRTFLMEIGEVGLALERPMSE